MQLNHHVKSALEEYTYDAAIIRVGINDILRCKDGRKLKELPNDIMKIAHKCQEHNIRKIFISFIVTCNSTFANTAKINKNINNIYTSNNFEFTECI